MSTVERKEYQETRIMRNRSPGRNLTQFDSNLDNLLEDLQNSVSRPGSSLGQNASSSYKETSKYISSSGDGYGRTNSLNRVTNLKSANPITEYSSDDAYSYKSPDGREKVHGYKKEKYMYGKSTVERDIGPEKSRMQNSINQLDSLLDDLQQVKKSSFSEKEIYNSTGTDPGYQTTTSVNRELHYGDTPPSSKSRTFERTEEKSYRKEGYSTDGTYGDIRPLRPVSPTSSRTSTLSKQTKVMNVHDYPIRVLETPVPDIDPEVLAHLDPNLHPAGNTKVTTTIKTYTYEIPGSGNYPTQVRENTDINEEYLNKLERYTYSPNDTITTPSKSFEYNKTENKENYFRQEPGWKDSTLKKSYQELVKDEVVRYRKPTPPDEHTTVTEEITTVRNYQPGYQPDINPPTRNQTYTYNETVTTKNFPLPPPPTTQETREYYINKETINRNQPPMSERGYPVYNPPSSPDRKKTYALKETQTTHTTNYQNGYPPQRQVSPPRDVETFNPQNPPYGKKPQEPINIQYSYKSTNSSENRYKGGYPPHEESQTLLPRKFPRGDETDGPPKRVEELMATIGGEPPNSPLNAGFTAHEREMAHKKVVETYKQQQAPEVEEIQKKEPATKNVTGPPVYYPPGHEMFANKEEGGGAWRAQGEYGKASGKYMYASESGAKSKTKKGMAVVPVCLPLCCGLPCTIL
ncbi:uncharacterized protein [Euwallacea fornicatus]|uniref:uncharacterized protein isoform X1 n=1 Tax=Euwallacea fornicatus TaxID=995702 RepID=UPI00339040C4